MKENYLKISESLLSAALKALSSAGLAAIYDDGEEVYLVGRKRAQEVGALPPP